MRIPQFVAQGGVPATSGQSGVPASAFGAEVYQGMGEVGKAAFSVVAQAEERKADLQRSTMYLDTSNSAKKAYADFEKQQLMNPSSLTHEADRDKWTKEYNDQALAKINDPIVKKAAISALGNLRGSAIVQARDQARGMAISEATKAGNDTIDAAILEAADSGMDPETVQRSHDTIDTVIHGLVNGVGVEVNIADQHRKKKLAEFWVGGMEGKIRVDPQGVRELLNKSDDPMVVQMKQDIGPKALFDLQQKALQQVVYNENLIETALKRRSDDNKAILYRMMSKAKSSADYADVQQVVDSLFSPSDHSRKGLDAGDAVWLQQNIAKMQEEGAPSDSSVVAKIEYQLYSTRGRVPLDSIYGLLGHGLNGKDVTRLAGLAESLQGKPGALSAAMATIEKAITPGMLETMTHEQKITYNLAMQELMTSTNYGNADPVMIRDTAFKIADRLLKSSTMTGGTSIFTSIEDMNEASRRQKLPANSIDKFLREMPLPPKWSGATPEDSWTKIAIEWGEYNKSGGAKGITPDMAKALHRKLFPEPLVKGKGK